MRRHCWPISSPSFGRKLSPSLKLTGVGAPLMNTRVTASAPASLVVTSASASVSAASAGRLRRAMSEAFIVDLSVRPRRGHAEAARIDTLRDAQSIGAARTGRSAPDVANARGGRHHRPMRTLPLAVALAALSSGACVRSPAARAEGWWSAHTAHIALETDAGRDTAVRAARDLED